MRVLHISAEVAPWAKTGGLGDVVGALPTAQEAAGGGELRTATVAPLYRSIRQAVMKRGLALTDTPIRLAVDLAGSRFHASVVRIEGATGAPLFLLDCPPLFDRDGIYDEPGAGRAWSDNPVRFAMLSLGALQAAEALLGGPPDIVHAHDWHAALALVYLRSRYARAWPGARGVCTVHNLAYQGVIDAGWLPALGIGWELFHPGCLEHHGAANLLKGGMATAHVVTAVSPTYAAEIRSPELGCGLDGFLRERPVVGIINGIDPTEWSPAVDPHIAAPYSVEDLDGKAACRAALLAETGIEPQVGEPVVGLVSRFTPQKGLDLAAALVPELHALGARMVVLGSGEADLQQTWSHLGRVYAWHCRSVIGFDVPLSHRITAGADIFLMPSRFEPCGLNQLYSMAYGTVPVVHSTGGLRDTVEDPGDAALSRGEGTGFRFDHPTVEGLRWALRRAVGLYRWHPDGWGRLMRAGMGRDWSWASSARRYLELYAAVVG